LKNNNYIDNKKFDEIYSTINEFKDVLPKVVEFSDLLYDESIKNEFNNYNSYEEGNYAITKIKQAKLWFKYYIVNSGNVYPL